MIPAHLSKYLAGLADGGLCVAFSGGVDSAVVLKAARLVCENVHAVTIHTPFHPVLEPEHARSLAVELGAVFKLIELDTLPDEILRNPTGRCYLCKRMIFNEILAYAAGNGLSTVLDGTNADDGLAYRPGLRALAELNIKSPLRELGITKEQVRGTALSLGISAAKKPSSPCLATRIPYNTRINPELLVRIDAFESFMRSIGFEIVRARIHGDTVRLEIPLESFADSLRLRESIIKEAKSLGFLRITLDLEGFRSGSFDTLNVIGGE